jgi:hypothetical protein
VAADRARDHARTGSVNAVVDEVAPIARRVETIRGIRFEKLPKPQVVTPEQTRETSLRELDEHYPSERRDTDAQLLALLGLVPPGTDLRDIFGDVSGEQVAGYYDTRRERLAVVSGPAAENRTIAEITLAHELTHALEDERFDLREDEPKGADDGSTAYSALVEGSATAVMQDYTRRYVSPAAAISSAFSALGAVGSTEGIPPYLQRSLEFSYTGGLAFIQALRDEGSGWKLVDRAFESKPPVSSEQIIHPDKYIHFERPVRVGIGDLGLGTGWDRKVRGTIGELDTQELIRLADSLSVADAETAASGWGGGSYQLWTNDSAAGDCDAPCRSAAVMVLRWAWDTPGDAREFDAALPVYVARGLDGEPAGAARWNVGDGGAAISIGPGDTTTLVLAPSPDEAARVARSASR